MTTDNLTVNSAHVHSKVYKTVGVTPLVVVPRDDFVEGIVERNARLSINNGRSAVMNEVLRHNSVVSVAQNSLQLSLGSSLKSRKQFFLGASVSKLDGKIHHGNIRGGTTNRHTSELAIKFRDHFADGLGSSGGRGNEVGNGSTIKRFRS